MTYEQFVKLETANLAKQAGFDWECPTFYTETFDYTNQESTGEFEFRRDDNLRYRNPNDDRNSFVNHKGTLLEYKFDMYSAPTQSVLQRWLREVKNIQLWVEFHNQRSDVKDGWIAFYGFYSSTILEIDYTSIYTTYEDALEVGLQECLTLLNKNL